MTKKYKDMKGDVYLEIDFIKLKKCILYLNILYLFNCKHKLFMLLFKCLLQGGKRL